MIYLTPRDWSKSRSQAWTCQLYPRDSRASIISVDGACVVLPVHVMTVNERQAMGEEMAEKVDEESPEKSIDGVTGTPKEAALRALMERTKYPIRQFNGQRRYGPPPMWNGPPPPRGSEVFVGKVPRDLYEDEIVPVFEALGQIYEIRLMMDFNGQNRGYAFVVYTNKEDAKKCVKTLNNYEIRKGKCIGVCSSVDNCRLFVGGIPKKVKRDEILAEISKVTDSVVDVIVYPSAQDKTKNRGFAFVEYTTHRDAAMARRKLMTGKIQLWGHQIAVDWAEPEQEVDEEIMDQVRPSCYKSPLPHLLRSRKLLTLRAYPRFWAPTNAFVVEIRLDSQVFRIFLPI